MAAITAVTAWSGFLARQAVVPQLRDIVRAYPAEGRLSVLPDYRPRSGAQRSALSVVDDSMGNVEFLRIASLAEQALASPTSLSIRTFAAVQLALGRGPRALETLRKAAETHPDALIWSDLASAYLTVGGRAAGLKALDAASRAYDLNPRALAVRFNYATSLQAVGLLDQARAEWLEYARMDRTSPWAALARTAARDTGAAVSAKPESAKDPATGTDRRTQLESAFAAWAAAPDNGARLDTACGASAAYAERYGDAFWLALCADGRGTGRTAVARGWKEFTCGQQAADQVRLPEARRCLAGAETTLETVSRAGLLATRLQRAIIDSQSGDLGGALRSINAIRPELYERRFLYLAARAEWLAAQLKANAGQHSLALAHYAKSRDTWQRLDETENALAVQSTHAGILRILGDAQGAWDVHESVLRESASVRHPRRRQGIFLGAGQAAASLGYVHAASRLLDEYVSAAETSRATVAIVEAHLNRLGAMAATWSEERKASALARIDQIAAAVDDQGRQAYIRALAALRRAALATPQAAAGFADEAMKYAEASGRLFLVPETRLARARALHASGDARGAERDLIAGLRELDRQVDSVSEPSYRVTFRDTGVALQESLVSLLLDQQRHDDAFAWFDRGRLRAFGQGEARGLTARAFQSQLGPDVTAMVYMTLGDRLAIWRLTADTSTVRISPIRVSEIVKQVTQWRTVAAAAGSSDADLEPVADALFDALIRPAGVLSTSRTIVVPDWPLHEVPFGTLRDRLTGKFVVESTAVVTSPSPSLAAGHQRLPTSRSIAAIGAPLTSADAYTFLPHLPEADREAREIARFYAARNVLTGARATIGASIDAIGHADVVHFATHGVANRERGELSYLVLTPENESDGRLTASALRQARWERTNLVVLAACSTAAGFESRSEGPLGLARAILAAGVPRVVATLWDVDDRLSRELLTEFHRAVSAGVDPIDALRGTQAALVGKRPLKQWSAFTVFATRLGATKETTRE